MKQVDIGKLAAVAVPGAVRKALLEKQEHAKIVGGGTAVPFG
jgi:hypothetical protein